MRRGIFNLAAVAVLLPSVALAWGFETHRRLTSRLHEPLPTGCLKTFIAAKQTSTFQDKSCDPDRWRDTDQNEWPRHFLQIDRVIPTSEYPRDYEAAVAHFGSDYYARRNGTVPWRVEEKYGHLVEAFRSGNETQVMNEIAYLSHYVTDAFSPLHDSATTDAKLSASDTDGMHRRYETLMLSGSTVQSSLAAEASAYYGTVGRADPRHRIFDIVATGQPFASQIAEADRETAGDTTALLAATRGFTARRHGDALTLLASLVASAWVDAGSPRLTSMSPSCDLAMPQGELELLGHPLPRDEEPEPEPEPDVDAGVPAGETPEVPPVGCGCASLTGVAVVLPALLLFALALRRRGRREDA